MIVVNLFFLFLQAKCEKPTPKGVGFSHLTCNMMKKSYEYYKNVELGGKLNILFHSKVTREYFSKYNVIKVIGNYPYTALVR